VDPTVTSSGLPSGLIRSPWAESFLELVSIAQRDLLLVSPFIKVQSTDQVLSNLQQRGVDKEIRVVVLTNLGNKLLDKSDRPSVASRLT
jgi:hypothetical protein